MGLFRTPWLELAAVSDEIKSAFEKAMEKVERMNLAPPTEAERLSWEAAPKGRKIAASYLNGEETLNSAIAEADPKERPYLIEGAVEVLTASIQLPKHEAAEKTTARALSGIKSLLAGLPGVQEVADRVSYVGEQFKTYGEQQRQQALQQLKQQFTAQLEQVMRQRGAAGPPPANVETMPEFQQEWMRVRLHLDQQYEGHLEGYRNEIRALAKKR